MCSFYGFEIQCASFQIHYIRWMKICFNILFLVLSTSLFAQDSTKISLNTLSIQTFGSGGISPSLKYDRVLHGKPKFKIVQTVGYSPAFDFTDSPAWYSESNFVFGKKKHHIETGLSVILVQYYRTTDLLITDNELVTGFQLGYRFQDYSKKGISFSLRAHLLNDENRGIHPGAALGYSF